MTTPTTILHPSFTFNGLQFTFEELKDFAQKLSKDGYEHEIAIGNFVLQWLDDSDTVRVKTSGSTGKPKKIKLQKKHMIASAKATGTYFSLGDGTSALLCLSADYIAGKMMLVRAMVLGWQLHVVAPEKDALTQYDNDYDFVAMVPYQVYHSLDALHKVKKIIVGGGSISSRLRKKLQDTTAEVYETYGMTETITHVAIKRVNGVDASNTFNALPKVTFTQDDRGCLCIEASHITESTVITNDVVKLFSKTSFEFLGRYDNVINSGGVKIHPEQIEATIAPYIQQPFIIIGQKAEALGEEVVMVVETKEPLHKEVYHNAFDLLSDYLKPKRILTLSQFPYTETGKIKRTGILQIIKKYKK